MNQNKPVLLSGFMIVMIFDVKHYQKNVIFCRKIVRNLLKLQIIDVKKPTKTPPTPNYPPFKPPTNQPDPINPFLAQNPKIQKMKNNNK